MSEHRLIIWAHFIGVDISFSRSAGSSKTCFVYSRGKRFDRIGTPCLNIRPGKLSIFPGHIDTGHNSGSPRYRDEFGECNRAKLIVRRCRRYHQENNDGTER